MDETPELESLVHFWRTGATSMSEPALIAALRAQRLLPLVRWRAAQQGWTLSDALTQAARAARYHNAVRGVVVEKQLAVLADVAQVQGVTAVLVKGPVTAHAYPEADLRIYNDLDLLLAPDEATGYLEALKMQGYTLLLLGDRSYHISLSPPGKGLRLELHPDLALELPDSPFTQAKMHQHLRPFPNLPGLWMLDAPAHVLYLVHHAVSHHQFEMGLFPFCDVYFCTHDWQIADWQALAALAEQTHQQRSVGLILALVAWFWDMPLAGVKLFPAPPQDVFELSRRLIANPQMQVMHVTRDVTEHSLRGWLRYAGVLAFGEPSVVRLLPESERRTYYIQRARYVFTRVGALFRARRRAPASDAAGDADLARLFAWMRNND